MSEKRFTFDDEVEFEIFDKETGQHYDGRIGHQKTLCILLNEQQEVIEELQSKLKEKEEDEKLYANEILELRETNKEWLQFKELGGDY